MSEEERRDYPAQLSRREECCVATRRREAGVSSGVSVGLALSGGGIRSATFGLGLIRALAKSQLLHRIDFLSTVSGGGYVGSFLGALYARPDPASVPKADAGRAAEVEAALAAPGSVLVGRLRENGRYLSPNGSGDTLLAAAVMLRNWIAIQVVVGTALLTLFVAADALRLALPNPSEAPELIRNRAVAGRIWWSAWMALPPLVLAVWVVPCAWAYWLVGGAERRPDRGLISRCLDWLGGNRGRLSLLLVPLIFLPALQDPFRSLLSWEPLSALASLVALGRSLQESAATLLRGDFALGFAAVRELLPKGRLLWPSAIVVVSSAFAAVFWIGPERGRRRLSVWLKNGLLVTAALLLFALLDSAGQTLYAVTAEGSDLWRWLAPLPAALAAAVPFAPKLLAMLKPAEPRKRPRIPLAVSSLLAAAVVAGAFTTAIAAFGDAIAWNGVPPANGIAGRITSTEPSKATEDALEGERLVAVLVLLGALSWCLGRAFSFLNDSTLAPLYAARLRRAYLGASNRKREEDGSKRAVTQDVEEDDISLASYRPWERGGPLHLVNVTLNETTNGSSQVEQRDRRGLGMAFGPGGISVGVHHHAVWKSLEDFAQGLAAVPLEGRFEVFPSADGHVISPEPLELSRVVAISGAAVSTGIGSRTSLGISLLLGLLNLRLGHWWYSGVDPRWRSVPVRTAVKSWLRQRFDKVRGRIGRWFGGGAKPAEEPPPSQSARPAAPGLWGLFGRSFSRHLPVQTHLLHEFLARFPGPASRNWYLSDGGHFENSGCYELIRRRLPLIVVSDCGADPEYEFGDFAHLVRKARLDFGAEIRLATAEELKRIDESVRNCFADPGVVRKRRAGPKDDAFAPIDDERRWNGAHAVLCFVDYDDPEDSSVLIWIKPSLRGDEPADVLNYALGCPSFPQEPTADQYFDEGQWESYQRLGLIIGERIFRAKQADSTLWHPASLDPSALFVDGSGKPGLVRQRMFG
jgi:hypothetical protein